VEKSPLGFKSLRNRGTTEPAPSEAGTNRQSTGLPDKPKPGWWPDDPAVADNPGEDANLHVGRGLWLKGEVSSCDRLTVEGDVEATIAARVLEISATGQVKGSADVESAEIDGRFDGQLTVRGCLSVRRAGGVRRIGSGKRRLRDRRSHAKCDGGKERDAGGGAHAIRTGGAGRALSRAGGQGHRV